MKKILCAILLFFCFAGYGFAQQTIEYCCTHYYKNSVKMKLEKPIFSYITFTDNYNRLYKSDEYGNATDLDNGRPCVFKFTKRESDYNIYKIDSSLYIERRAYGNFDNTPLFQPTYKFSVDLSVYNFVPNPSVAGFFYGIMVYKRVTKAEKEAILREYEESLPKLLQ